MTEQKSIPQTQQAVQTEKLYEALQQSMDTHTSDEMHDIENEDMEHFGQSLSDLSPLPLRRL